MKAIRIGLMSTVMAALATVAACTGGVYVSTYVCDEYYDWFYGYYYTECYYLSSDGEKEVTRDVVTEAADREELALRSASKFYGEKFSLNETKARQMAKVVADFSKLKDRTDADLAQFAERLYGINTQQLASAVSNAQVGDNSKLNEVISQAADNFQTSRENMKEIVNYMHGKALREAGVNLN
jgi:hypothetical protein